MNSYLHVLTRLCEEVQAGMANKVVENDEIDWNVDVEVLLSCAIEGHKPVGVNRYFMMACIHHKFSNYLNRQITSKPIWDHLDSMYDMAALHESEIIPFPNEEKEFELPDEFESLKKEKKEVASAPDSPPPLPPPTLTRNESSVDVKPNIAKPGRKSTIPKAKQVQVTLNVLKEKDFTAAKVLPSTIPVSVKLSRGPIPAKVDLSINNSLLEPNLKVKLEPVSFIKSVKSERSASPLNIKTGKIELNMCPQVKLQSTSLELLGKKMKLEIAPVSKKTIKQEREKPEVETSKKTKGASTSTKKMKTPASTEVTSNRRNSKSDTSGQKKKTEIDTTKKNVDGPPSKTSKAEAKTPQNVMLKGVKIEDADPQPTASTSKASRTQTKNEPAENPKKRKRARADESPTPKKTQPVTKRRRT